MRRRCVPLERELLPVDRAETLKRGRKMGDGECLSLRTVNLARDVGLSTQQVRNYEAWGFIPRAPRSASGYRLYSDLHLRALRTARLLVLGYSWQHALGVMRAVHAGDFASALAIADARHAQLHRAREDVARFRAVLDAVPIESGDRLSTDGAELTRIGAVATVAGVRVSAVRFWERRGLIAPRRDAQNRYRLYDRQAVRRVRVVALLRQAGYDIADIHTVLEDLTAGRPDEVLKAVEKRVVDVGEASRACARATAALWEYMEAIS